jgi:multicomponent Na+:H+ antiporter subunit E
MAQADPKVPVRRGVLLFLYLLFLWTILAGVGLQATGVGIAAALVITFFFARRASAFDELRFAPKRIVYAFIFLLVFLKALILSSMDVAYRTIHPKLPIKPGIVKLRTGLKTRIGRVVLANSITLTPGTITVEEKGEWLYIHWINVSTIEPDESFKKIAAQFERYLEVIFG